ncbi:hypothetical protein HDR60_04950, partial [bacterium]|nr:hypothetical protein [bacterium]
LGVVGSSLLTINANADTIYMCKTCKAGTYANNNKCETCPAGSYCIDGVKHSCQAGTFSTSGASSCSACPDGYYVVAGTASCTACPAGYYCKNNAKYECADGQYQDATTQASCKPCPSSTKIRIDHYLYNYSNSGGCQSYAATNKDLTLHSGQNMYFETWNNIILDLKVINTEEANRSKSHFLNLTINNTLYEHVGYLDYYSCYKNTGKGKILLSGGCSYNGSYDKEVIYDVQ